jgi:hypothetical protein
MKLLLSTLLLTLFLQAPPSAAQERPPFRLIPIPNREHGYGNFESIALNSKAEFDSFIAGTSKQGGWNSHAAFVDALRNANIDFTREALVLLRHTEGSGTVRVTFETPTLVKRKLVCQIRGKALTGGGTMDMAYYCFAVVVSRSAVSEVELRDVVGGFEERELPPVVFPIRTQSSNSPGSSPADKANSNHEEEAIARLFAMIDELKSEPDTPAAALLQSEIADVLWRSDEPAARAIFRAAFDSVTQLKIDSSSSLDAEAKRLALREGRRRANAIKTILKRYGFHDQKGAENWLQDLENRLQDEKKNSARGSRMSVEQAELIGEIAVGLVRQDPKEAARLGALSLTAESIPTSFSRLMIALRSVDQTLSDELFRQALLTMRANGLRYDSTLVSLANYEFFANGRPFQPGTSGGEIGLLIQYFVDAAGAQLALLQGGALTPEQQASLGSLYSFLNSRALPIVALNAPAKLTLLQSNLAEIARGLTPEQRQQAERAASFHRQPDAGENDSDVDAQIRRAEQEKDVDTRDYLFRDLVVQLMRGLPEKALEVARKIDDLELRAQSEDDVYLVMLEDAFRSNSNETAKSVALKINDKASQARWLAEIAVRRPRSKSKPFDEAAATASLSEAYTIAMKSDNDAAKVDALMFIAQQFLQFNRDRGFEIVSDALKIANRVDPKPRTPFKAKGPGGGIISMTVVNGKERSTVFRPTLQSITFNEIADFAKTDYLQATGLGDNLTSHLLRAKYFIAIGRSILGVPREGPAYELTLEDLLNPN